LEILEQPGIFYLISFLLVFGIADEGDGIHHSSLGARAYSNSFAFARVNNYLIVCSIV
jgi:hypothetical protein